MSVPVSYTHLDVYKRQVQSEAAGKKYEYSLLFTHAQDTVMTVCTEMNLARKMITMYRELDRRLNVLEKKDGGRYD